MASSIRLFWTRLDQSVHPDDRVVFDGNPHSFNLSYPPPAFIGDVDSAPVIVLMANGGYGPGTVAEFPSPGDHRAYIDWLTGATTEVPRRLSPYYTRHKLYPLIRSGKLAIVNAVAYRSPKITEEKDNQRVAELLPSTKVHRRWLREEVLPAVRQGRRMVIAHRHKLWKLSDLNSEIPFLVRTTNPASSYLADAVMVQVEEFLRVR